MLFLGTIGFSHLNHQRNGRIWILHYHLCTEWKSCWLRDSIPPVTGSSLSSTFPCPRISSYVVQERDIAQRPPTISSIDNSPCHGYTTPMVFASLLLSPVTWFEIGINASSFGFRGISTRRSSGWPSTFCMAVLAFIDLSDTKVQRDMFSCQKGTEELVPFLVLPTTFLPSFSQL